MKFYDKALIEAASREIGFPEDMIADHDQKLTNSLLYNFALGTLRGAAFPNELESKYLPLTEQVFRVQKQTIEEAAKQGPAVFIGRCADAILQDRDDVLRVFVYADIEKRKQRAIEEYGEMEECISRFIRENDKRRRIHYENYTDQRWGDRENYDLMLNSGFLGIDKCVDLICEAAK